MCSYMQLDALKTVKGVQDNNVHRPTDRPYDKLIPPVYPH